MVNPPDTPSGYQDVRQNRQLISLRSALFVRFGLIGVGAVLLFTLAYFFFGFFPLVNRIAASQFDTTIKTAEGSLHESLSLAEQVVRIAVEWGGTTGFEADRPEAFNEHFRPVLKNIPQATSIVAGTTDGFGWLLLQLPEGRWLNRFTDVAGRGSGQLFFEWQDDRLTRRYTRVVDYDPRERLWFRMAMAAPADGRPHWTPPYRFFTTGEPGITVSVRRDLPNGRSLVLGMDLKLIDISTISSGLSVGEQGYVLVLTDDGKVLGLPRKEVLGSDSGGGETILAAAEELGLEPVNLSLALWRADRNAYLKPEIVKAQGERWLFVMHPLSLGEQTFWIAAYAPVADFLPSIFNIGKAVAASLALVLVLTFVAARRQARRISRPLEALSAASGKIARLDFSDNPPVTTRWREIDALVASQANMLAMLRHYDATVTTQAAELREQVDILRATQEQLHRILQQEQVILENALTGIVLMKDRKVLRCNQRAAEIFGFGSASEMEGLDSEFIYEDHDKFLATGEKAYGAFARGEFYGEELWLMRRDGSSFWGYIQGRSLNVADPLGGGSVWIVSDLTERKEMDRMKEEMLSAVGHEVRTPLTGMMGYAELMMEMDLTPEQRQEYLGIIYHETERLAELFDNFLNLQSLKSVRTPLNLRPVNIEQTLNEAAALFRNASRRHHLLIDCPPGLPPVRGDADQLHRVFLNLVSNAIKYSPDGGRVTLAAAAAEGTVIIRVEDEGIGISPAAQTRIFDSFFRVDNKDNRRIGGTGLGLALVREAVQKHGGRVWVESEVGRGSTFFVSLPRFEA